MYALFKNKDDYLTKLNEVNQALGYPNLVGTNTYATEEPILTICGHYAMPVVQHVQQLFNDEELVESVEWDTLEE